MSTDNKWHGECAISGYAGTSCNCGNKYYKIQWPVQYYFFFVNAGSEPLLITSAFSSCGCVVPEFPKQPILPGEKSSIKVRYNTNIVGDFTKVIVVKSNAKNNPKSI